MTRVLVAISAVFAACGAPHVEQRTLPQSNPTQYDFGASVEAVHEAVDTLYIEQFDERPLNSFSIAKADDELLTDEQRKRFMGPGGADDRYLWFMHEPMSLSPVYFFGGEPAPYIADLYLKIEALEDQLTRVSVEALDAHVLAGKTLLPRHEFSRANIYLPVSSTTVEEYQLLLRIGEILGQSGMSSLQLPKDAGGSR
jgi:hypothetical protein